MINHVLVQQASLRERVEQLPVAKLEVAVAGDVLLEVEDRVVCLKGLSR
jgi:hypothetical protein